MKKYMHKRTSATIALVAMALSCQLSALDNCYAGELSFSGGWRQDHLRSSTTTNIDTSTDLVRGSQLNIWQVGLQGWMSPYMSECDPWLNNFFVRGSAYWGWVDEGVYLHRTTPGPDAPITFDRGDISRGHTWDYSIGGGLLFSCGSGLKIGPAGGYASNKLTFKAENVLGAINTPNTSSVPDPLAYFDEGVLFSSKWQGPWAGVDLLWSSCGLSFYASYEYHWARWNGAYTSPSLDLDDNIHFSDTRSGRHGWGHTGYLGAHYAVCDTWLVGLGVKYQYFHTGGSLIPRDAGGFPAVGGVAEQVDSVKTTWNSVAVVLDLGLAF